MNHRFRTYAWGVLAYNLLVILWGAYVRATGSGAGCGSHWPLCNGEVIPQTPQVETLIEFVHRLTSGLSLVLVIGLAIGAFRLFPRAHRVRLGAGLSLGLTLTEALLGALLVLFSWTGQDTSIGRVISMPVHLLNTLFLLGALTFTAWWASGGESLSLRGQGLLLPGVVIGLAGTAILSATGAITALGDTLFPSASLAHGLSQDFSASAHILLRLRVWHPVLAVIVGVYLLMFSGLLALFRPETKRLAWMLFAVVVLQLLAGIVNLVLLAPVWMQLVHLLLADSVWLLLILSSARALERSSLRTARTPSLVT